MNLISGYVGSYGSELVVAIFMPLQDLNCWGVTNIPLQVIFACIGWIGSSIGVVGNMAMAPGCRERILLQPKPAPVTKTMFYFLKNKYLLRNCFFYMIDALNNAPSDVFAGEIGREIAGYTEYVTGERPYRTGNLLTNMVKSTFFYDPTGGKHEQMYIALNERRALMATEVSDEMQTVPEMLQEEEEAE